MTVFIKKALTENILLKILALALAIATYEALKPQADEQMHQQKNSKRTESIFHDKR